MKTKWRCGCAIVALSIVASVCRADAGSEDEIAKLRAQVKKLDAENEALRAEIARLKAGVAELPGRELESAHRDSDLRRLLDLEKALATNSGEGSVRAEAAALASRLAPLLVGNPLVWRMLVKTRTLKDGMTLADAEKLVGPPTEKSDSQVGWYFNPDHRRHVADYLHAKVTKDGLTEWRIDKR